MTRLQSIRLRLGDCREVMSSMEENSVGFILADPPYGIAFMSNKWDTPWRGANLEGVNDNQKFEAWNLTWLNEAYRVLKPGGQIKVFGASRTFHRAARAMIKSGFEGVRLEAWVQGEGFPKGGPIGKAIRKRIKEEGECPEEGLTSDMAEIWRGHAVTLKSAWEPIMVASKPPNQTREKAG